MLPIRPRPPRDLALALDCTMGGIEKVADLLELSDVILADAEFVRAHTGFTIGGVAPVALLHPVETVVDISLSRYEQVWAAAGHPYTVFPTSYDELLRLTGGHAAEVA